MVLGRSSGCPTLIQAPSLLDCCRPPSVPASAPPGFSLSSQSHVFLNVTQITALPYSNPALFLFILKTRKPKGPLTLRPRLQVPFLLWVLLPLQATKLLLPELLHMAPVLERTSARLALTPLPRGEPQPALSALTGFLAFVALSTS